MTRDVVHAATLPPPPLSHPADHARHPVRLVVSALLAGAGTRVDTPGYDEAHDTGGAPRPCYRETLDALGDLDLERLQTDVARRLAVRQVTFGRGRPFVV